MPFGQTSSGLHSIFYRYRAHGATTKAPAPLFSGGEVEFLPTDGNYLTGVRKLVVGKPALVAAGAPALLKECAHYTLIKLCAFTITLFRGGVLALVSNLRPAFGLLLRDELLAWHKLWAVGVATKVALLATGMALGIFDVFGPLVGLAFGLFGLELFES